VYTRRRYHRSLCRKSNCSLLLIYRPRKDQRLSRPGWLPYSGRFTHISGHPSAASRAQDTENSPVKDQRSTAIPRNQPTRREDALTCDVALNDRHPVGRQRPGLVRANGCRVAHRLAGVQMSDEVVVVHHFLR